MTRSLLPSLMLSTLLLLSCQRNSSTDFPSESQGQPAIVEGKAAQDSCIPRMKVVPRDKHTFRDGGWDYIFNVILVGCEQDLRRITAEDERTILSLAEDAVRKEGLHIVARHQEDGFRSALQKEVNESMRDSGVTDIYFNLLMTAEYM